jgi:hypothetical protein
LNELHEAAHALGIGYDAHSRERAETLTESVTLIACGSIGLDTSGVSIPYVASWDRSDMTDLHAFATLVDATARRIEHALLADDQPKADQTGVSGFLCLA